jgi:hypothetical protein
MVRHKSRWLLVTIETEDQVKNLIPSPPQKQDSSPSLLRAIDKSGIFHAISNTMQHAFGVAVAGIIEDIQGAQLILLFIKWHTYNITHDFVRLFSPTLQSRDTACNDQSSKRWL